MTLVPAQSLRVSLLVMSLASLSCGADEANAEVQPFGVWVTPLTGEFDCATALSLNEDYTYQMAYGCSLTNGQIGLEVETGGYFAERSGGLLSLYPEKYSCDEHITSQSYEYAIDGDKLRVLTDTGALVMQRDPGGGGAASFVYGCWSDDGDSRFTKMPLHDL